MLLAGADVRQRQTISVAHRPCTMTLRCMLVLPRVSRRVADTPIPQSALAAASVRTRARVRSALPKPPLSLHSSNRDKEGETERLTRAAESTMTLALKINQPESVPTRGHLCSPTKTQEKSSQWRSTVSMLIAVAALSCSGFGFVDATWLDGLSAATNKSTCKPTCTNAGPPDACSAVNDVGMDLQP